MKDRIFSLYGHARIRISCCSLCRVSCSQSVWNALQEWVLFLLWLLNMRFSGIFHRSFLGESNPEASSL